MPQLTRPVKQGQWSESALRVLRERYLNRSGGKVSESPEDMCWRVAWAIANAEVTWAKTQDQVHEVASQFYALMVDGYFQPNSPTLMNAGKDNGLQYSACFVLPVGDSMDEIFEAVKRAAIIHKSGGGTGFAFSRLRPKDTLVKSTGGKASGPVSFLRVFNGATEAVKQGGTRRGANMGILKVDHPDILEFIHCKLDGGIANFNISVTATDKFMEALEKDGEYDLVDPHTLQATGRLRAREVFDRIVDAAWRTGDPGLVFIDRVNRSPANPVPELETIEATNPCVPADTWVMTQAGPRQVRDLIGTPFEAIVDGEAYGTGAGGFFKTGTQPLVRVQTVEGYSVRLTADHRVRRVTRLTRDICETEWIQARGLQPGDLVLLHNHRQFTSWGGAYTEGEGYLIGLLVGDGTLKADKAVLSVWVPAASAVANGPAEVAGSGVSGVMRTALDYARALPHRSDFRGWVPVRGRSEYRMAPGALRRLASDLGMAPGRKEITPQVEQASSDFYRGFLRGLFDTDGSVQGSQVKGISIRLAQSDQDRLHAIQRMLLRLGIASTLYEERRSQGIRLLPDQRGGRKEYATVAQHELVISGDNLLRFAERIGFADSDKAIKLKTLCSSYRRRLNRERFTARVASVTEAGTEDIYDVQVPGVNAFDANGLYAHNCGEQPLAPNDACNLGSINLDKFARPDDPTAPIAWDDLERVVRLSVRFLDDVIEVNPYPLPEIMDEVKANRRIGLGVMGWADLLIQLGIPYDSEAALELGDKVMEFITTIGRDESARLAEERGPFPNWPRSIYRDGRPIRNSTVTTIAPTGTISIIAGCSSGIEPLFAVAYSHIVGDRHLTFVNPHFEQVARRRGFYSPELMEKVAKHGTLHGIAEVPEDVKRVFVTAHEIEPEWHVRMQAAFQRYTDNGVSKTINLPRTATVEDVTRAYRLSYELGCLGITVFRDGCKSAHGGQVLHVGTTAAGGASVSTGPTAAGGAGTGPAPGIDTSIKPRPRTLRGVTYRVDTPLGTGYVHVNQGPSGEPFEVFLNVGKAGTDVHADAEALGRLISLILRLPSPLTPRERVEQIAKQLDRIGGRRDAGMGPGRVRSIPDAIAQVLAEHVGLREPGPEHLREAREGRVKATDMCPDCQNFTLVFEEGCQKCHVCGFSEC